MNMNHTVRADKRRRRPLGKDESFSHVFDATGTVAYHCEIHPFMTGTITVGDRAMAQTHNIEITAMAFPDDVPIAKGDTVVWTNRMNAKHTVTADDGAFDSGQLAKDQSFSRVFDTAGTIPYHCNNHPTQMTGTVTVT
jgi:plastocyanin